MKWRELFSANFEESLNLQDNPFQSYMARETESKPIYTKKFLKSIFMIMGILLLYLFVEFGRQFTSNDGKNISLKIEKVNLLPLWLFYLCLIIWLVIWFYTIKNRYKAIMIYSTILNLNNYLIWLLLFINLLFISVFISSMTYIGVALFYIITIIMSIQIISHGIRYLFNILFGHSYERNWIDKSMRWLSKYVWIIVIAALIIRFIFPNSMEIKRDLTTFILLVFSCFVYNIIVVATEIYLFFPYILVGYYKLKYAEEYREWEGKTREEWYGEKYLKKQERKKRKK